MARQTLHLPDGQTFTVTPVFGGVAFKSHELNTHHHAFPIGWTIVLHTEDDVEAGRPADDDMDDDDLPAELRPRRNIHPLTKPTMQNDALFISSISNPSSSEFKPATSPTRQIAMMLWVSLYWYFHQPEPSLHLNTEASKLTPELARPKGDWKVNIRRDGILRSKNLIPKLERMGLIASANTSVGTSVDDSGDAWTDMFISRRMFWQIPGRLFLFTLQPTRALASFPGSPVTSRPGSPTRSDSPLHRQTHSQSPHLTHQRLDSDLPGAPVPTTVIHTLNFPVGPFYSSSHLPTYYPPPPMQYTFTNDIRHPLRPKPPRMGETFYARFIPSVGQFLSLRVASSSPKPVPHLGPTGPKAPEHPHLCTLSDTALLQMWLQNPRVKAFWGDYNPNFLNDALGSCHSFPAIGLWDGVPFGYFEIYWVKEDILGRQLGGEAGNWDRGLHVLVGEEWARGRVPTWLTGLVHWCFTADYRTMNVCLEPRIDNERCVRIPETSALLTIADSSTVSKPVASRKKSKCPSRTNSPGTSGFVGIIGRALLCRDVKSRPGSILDNLYSHRSRDMIDEYMHNAHYVGDTR